MKRLFPTWLGGIFIGFLASPPLGVEYSNFQVLAPPIKNELISIFLKNSLASLATIFMGLFLCFLELKIYKKLNPRTYAFLETLTTPLYFILSKIYPKFGKARPFFRSCLFYLLFIPYFSVFVNGIVLGLLLGINVDAIFQYLQSIFPYAMFEIPAMFASACVALFILTSLEKEIIGADLANLEKKMKAIIRKALLFATVILVVLFIGALMEAR